MNTKSTSNQPAINQIVPQRYCMQCNKLQTSQNILRDPFGPGWSICTLCLKAEGERLLKFKLDKVRLYPEIDMIMDGLYLGNQDAATDLQTINKYQISAICTCGSYLLTPFEGLKREGKFESIQYMKYDIADFYDQKIDNYFDSNCQWIQDRIKEGRNVLVHCAAGVSRSASFVIAYLMNKKQMVYPDALSYVKKRRRVISPNSGFKVQLENYGKLIISRKLGSLYILNQQKQQKQQQISNNSIGDKQQPKSHKQQQK